MLSCMICVKHDFYETFYSYSPCTATGKPPKVSFFPVSIYSKLFTSWFGHSVGMPEVCSALHQYDNSPGRDVTLPAPSTLFFMFGETLTAGFCIAARQKHFLSVCRVIVYIFGVVKHILQWPMWVTAPKARQPDPCGSRAQNQSKIKFRLRWFFCRCHGRSFENFSQICPCWNQTWHLLWRSASRGRKVETWKALYCVHVDGIN